jgi:broad specificity phosphatase PhoE
MKRTYLFARHAHALHQTRGLRAYPRGTDVPLSEAGTQQARALGRALKGAGCQRIVSSSLLRARQTAGGASEESGIVYDGAWEELNEVSPLELRTSPRRLPEWCEALAGAWALHRHARGVPSLTHDVAPIEERARTVLARLDAIDEERIAVVSHGYFILLLSLVVPGSMRLTAMENCCITTIESDGRGQHVLKSFGEPSR